jgi:hypothetical protein
MDVKPIAIFVSVRRRRDTTKYTRKEARDLVVSLSGRRPIEKNKTRMRSFFRVFRYFRVFRRLSFPSKYAYL